MIWLYHQWITFSWTRSKEMIQLYEILLKAPGVLGARFSGAGFRGCCLAIVESDRAEEAAAYVAAEYEKAQPELVSRIPANRRVLVCEPGDSACVILPDGDRLRSRWHFVSEGAVQVNR
nr:unnamed protein product [Digitaria exilis]